MRRLSSRLTARLSRIHSALRKRFRSYALLSAALSDFKRNDLRYHTYYFAVNAFIGVLALFVAVTSLIAIIARGNLKSQLVEGIKSVMPILRGGSTETLNVFSTYRGVAGVISLVFLLWAGTRIFSALEHGFSIIWGSEKRRYGHAMLVGLLMIAVIGGLFLVTFAVQFGFNKAWAALFESGSPGYYFGVSLAKPVTGFLVDFLMFFFIYRVVTGVKPALKSCAVAAVLAAALFLGTQYLLNVYFDYVYKVPLIYGSLASGIVVILWMQLTGMLTFYGAEVIRVMEEDQLG